MKKILFFVVVFLMSSYVFSQTDVSGTVNGVWTKANSPYNVTDTLIIPADDTLTIEAGVTVNFQGQYKFYVEGTLLAEGTETDTIIFTAENETEGWAGLRFQNQSANSVLKYCKFQYGNSLDGTFPSQHGGAVVLDAVDAIFEHCVFINNTAIADDNGMGGAVYAINTENTRFSNCSFINNESYGDGGAVRLAGDVGSVFDSCVFINNKTLYGGGAISFYGAYYSEFFRCLFARNYTVYSSGGVASITGYCADIEFTNCTMVNNQAVYGDGGAIELAYSNAIFTNSIIYNNHGQYSDDIFLDMDGNAEINYCNVNIPDGATGGNNIYTDAMFVDTANLDFHLLENSPCIDAGIDSLTITDPYNTEITVIDLDTDQYSGSNPDMGAYEYGSSPEPSLNADIQNNFIIYPNPVKNTLYINNVSSDLDIEIFDIAGHKIKQATNVNQIDVSELNKGIYFIKLFYDGTSQMFKFVK